MLRKYIYSYEYIDEWEKFNETSLPEKEDFHRYLNMEDIIDADYAHVKIVCKAFEIKKLGECHDLYVQSNTLLLLMVEKGIRGGICHFICQYAKGNNKYMKNYDKNKELHLQY